MTTVHLVYPHGDRISCPDAIGRELAERLRRHYDVRLHDWDDTGTIVPLRGDVLVGHPHPAPWTVFRRSARQRGWWRVIVLAPYNHVPGQVAFADRAIRSCDRYLAITGRYWYDSVLRSPFAHWWPKMTHVDLAVDPADFPPIKSRFNVPAERRFLYIGHAAHMKNIAYLQAIARAMPHAHFGWIGGGPDAPPLNRYGSFDFRTTSARDLVAKYDFLITVGRADANPATVLEAMAWGLVPICTSSSGYSGYDSIVNVPLDDIPSAVVVLRRLQSAQEEDLSRLQQKNWQLIDEHFNWDRFAAQVIDAIEGEPAPAAARLSAIDTARLRLASFIDRDTLRFRARALRKALSSLS